MADRAQGIPVAKEGVPFILIGAGVTLGTWAMGATWVASFFGLVTLFVTWFFRNPARTIPVEEQVVVSPGDGTVVAVESEFEHRFLKEQSIRISIFLNVFDVHITECQLGVRSKIWCINQENS